PPGAREEVPAAPALRTARQRSQRSGGTMREVVIAEAVRSPIGRRNGGLSTMHAVDLLATVQEELIKRSGIDPAQVEQVIGGCVTQVGMQAWNVTRSAWLTAGLPLEAPATTIDAQSG